MPQNSPEDLERRQEVTNATLALQLKYIQLDIDTIKKSLDDKYVTKSDFAPIRMIVYGAAAVVGTGFIGAIVSYFLVKQ